MIKSMTGYGKTEINLADKNLSIEVRSLNSKQSDINIRIPSSYKSKEIQLRNLISKSLGRGKIELSIYSELNGENSSFKINSDLAKFYHKQLKEVEPSLSDTISEEMFSILLKFPEVMTTSRAEIDEDEWTKILEGVNSALNGLNEFRLSEGKNLQDDLVQRIKNIEALSIEVAALDAGRVERVRERIGESIKEIEQKSIDKNRFEQEIIFYLEKLDITEEKVRLASHLKYFIETLDKEDGQGKKLGFISQEIGREVNTIGSKANDAEMQKLVVQMKDELEKIKEQVLNVL